jgi:hypothetical protein
MKTFVITLLLAGLGWFRAGAQVTVELRSDQNEFLPGETIPLAVKITNLSGQQLHFGSGPGWLTFSVESSDGFDVVKISDVPVPAQFDLFSSQAGTLHVDIAPCFQINRIGHYKVTAYLRLKDWASNITSPPKEFDVVTGVKLWSQEFGVPSAGGPPELREFSLEKANYLRQQLRLYLQLTDAAESRIYKVVALGPMVSFGYPDERIDRTSQLHVLWQTGAQSFSYCVVSPDGKLLQRDLYEIANTRPKLKVDDNGEVTVEGGIKRVPEAEIPPVHPPDDLPPASQK